MHLVQPIHKFSWMKATRFGGLNNNRHHQLVVLPHQVGNFWIVCEPPGTHLLMLSPFAIACAGAATWVTTLPTLCLW